MSGLALIDDDGFEKVDGDGLGVDDSCAAECCGGACAMVGKYVACPPIPGADCSNDPLSVWVCLPAGCEGGAIHWRNRCYRRASPPEEIPRANLNADDIVLHQGAGDNAFAYDCLDGCADLRCTVCFTYLRCSPCGAPVAPGPGEPPMVYIARTRVTRCGLVGRFANAQGTQWCFTVGPDADAVGENGVPPGSQFATTDPLAGRDCCDCGANCGNKVIVSTRSCADGSYTRMPCCCPGAFTVTVRYRLRQVVFSVPMASQNYSTFEADATYSFTFKNGNYIQPLPTIRHTKKDYSLGVLVNTIISDVPAPLPFCGSEPNWQVADYIVNHFVCPVDAGNAPGLVINLAVASKTCNSGTAQGDWAVFADPNSPLASQTTTFFFSYSVQAIDPCGTNCRSSGNALATPVAPAGSRAVKIATGMAVSDGALPDGRSAARLFMRG